MATYDPVFTEIDINDPLECWEFKVSTNGLEILFVLDGERKLAVHFYDHIAFRMLDEGDALVDLNNLYKSGRKDARFFKVQDSDFLEWFHTQSYGLRRGDAISHYSIFSSNDVIDVISFGEPTFKFLVNNPE